MKEWTFEETYQSVHDRWEKYASGDFTTPTHRSCAFCEFNMAMRKKWQDCCEYCPAYHALGRSWCRSHPDFYHSEMADVAVAVLDLLEQLKPELEKAFTQILKGELP